MAGQVHLPARTNRREPAALDTHLSIEYECALGRLGGAGRAPAHHAVALDAPLGLPRILWAFPASSKSKRIFDGTPVSSFAEALIA
jgi:hypothetical protein